MVSRNHKSLVVITFGLCLGISACSDNSAVGIRYEAEKKYYAAEQALKDVRSEGGQLQVNGFAEVYIFFRDANDFCYAGLETIDQTTHPVEFNELRYLTVRSSLKLAQLFYTARKFDSAQTTLNRLLKEVQLSQKQRLPIYLYMGKTLQASGNFDSALVVFDFVIQDYYPPIDNGGEIVMGAFTLPTQIYHSRLRSRRGAVQIGGNVLPKTS
jgi:tetratricopeptide (TPR) repeat protein